MSEQPTVLVTGVSRGLGLEITRDLIAHDFRVLGICRTVSQPLEALKEQNAAGLRVLTFDLGQLDRIKEKVFAEPWFDASVPLAGVVNNAGIAYDDLITNFQADAIENMLRVNLTAPMLLCREAIRHMIYHRNSGSFVHISSVCAHTGYKGLAAYAATKGGLEAFSRTLAREWGSRGIRSNCVAAGFMETDMSGGLQDEDREAVRRRSALKAFADARSVAATVRFLLSPEAGSITGATLGVDAGAR